jgi:hypothetical protein
MAKATQNLKVTSDNYKVLGSTRTQMCTLLLGGTSCAFVSFARGMGYDDDVSLGLDAWVDAQYAALKGFVCA